MKRILNRNILLTVFCFALLIFYYFNIKNPYLIEMKKQVDWLSNLQTTNGAIRDHSSPSKYNPLRYKITPYFANIAAESMTLDSSKLNSVKKYIIWYINHLNCPDKETIDGKVIYGTIYDYYISDTGDETTENHYDSADSYASTFLSLLKSYYLAGGDINILIDNKVKIYEIMNVVTTLMDEDGLTYAKPNFKVKYLMDNCESYKGLIDASFLCEHVFDEKAKSLIYKNKANVLKLAIVNDLKNGNEFFVSKVNEKYQKVDWNEWYPDSVSQIYPSLFGIIENNSEQSIYLYNKLSEKWDWSNLNASNDFPLDTCRVCWTKN